MAKFIEGIQNRSRYAIVGALIYQTKFLQNRIIKCVVVMVMLYTLLIYLAYCASDLNYTLNPVVFHDASNLPLDYGANWILRQNYGSFSENSILLNNVNTSTTTIPTSFGNISKLLVENRTLVAGNGVMVKNINNSVSLFNLSISNNTMSFSMKYISNITANDMVFGHNKTAFFINRTNKVLFKIDTLNFVVVSNYSFVGQQPLQLSYDNGVLIVYTKNLTTISLANIILFDNNLNILRELAIRFVSIFSSTNVSYAPQYHLSISFDNATSLALRTTSQCVEVYSFNSLSLAYNFTNTSSSYISSVVCKQFVVIVSQTSIQFWQIFTWQLIKTNFNFENTIPLQALKCFDFQNVVAVFQKISLFGIGYVGAITYFNLNFTPTNFNFTNTTNLTNTTNITNITNLTNITNTTNLINTTNLTNFNITSFNLTNITIQSNSTQNNTNTNNTMQTNQTQMNTTNLTNIAENNQTNLTNLAKNEIKNASNPYNISSANSTINETINSTNNINISMSNTSIVYSFGNTTNSTASLSISNNTIFNTVNNTNNTNNNNANNNNINSTNINQTANSTSAITNTTYKSTTQLITGIYSFSIQAMRTQLNKITQFFTSQSTKNVQAKLASITGVASANPITKALFKPILNLLDDFWFYQFHSLTYPQFVELFTAEVDVLNQLRIKPSFLDYDIQFPICDYQNELYANQSILQQRAPNSIFVFISMKDVYTTNFMTVLIQFAVFRIFFLLAKLFRHKHKLIFKLYRFLQVNSLWWTLLIGMLQSNNAVITFYSSVQFNQFVSFDFFSKANLVFTTFICFTVFCFTFAFYPLLLQFEKPKYSEQAFDLSIYSPQCFWIQILLKCIRTFGQALLHGIFINLHYFQLMGLIFLDFSMLLLIIAWRRHFKSKISFVLILFYFSFFLAFDISLMSFSVQKLNDTYTQVKSIQYNFLFAIIVLALLVIAFLRIAVIVIIQVIEKIHSCRSVNKIKVQEIKQNYKGKSKKLKQPNSLQKYKVRIKQKYQLFQNSQITLNTNKNTTISKAQLNLKQQLSIQELKQNINAQQSEKNTNIYKISVNENLSTIQVHKKNRTKMLREGSNIKLLKITKQRSGSFSQYTTHKPAINQNQLFEWNSQLLKLNKFTNKIQQKTQNKLKYLQ